MQRTYLPGVRKRAGPFLSLRGVDDQDLADFWLTAEYANDKRLMECSLRTCDDRLLPEFSRRVTVAQIESRYRSRFSRSQAGQAIVERAERVLLGLVDVDEGTGAQGGRYILRCYKFALSSTTVCGSCRCWKDASA